MMDDFMQRTRFRYYSAVQPIVSDVQIYPMIEMRDRAAEPMRIRARIDARALGNNSKLNIIAANNNNIIIISINNLELDIAVAQSHVDAFANLIGLHDYMQYDCVIVYSTKLERT